MTELGEIKRDRPCNRRWLLRHGALALPFILVGTPARAVERVGSVEDVKGEAFAELDAVRRTLDRAAPVFLGDEVVTGVASRMGMRLGRDTTIRLGEQARLKIDRFLVDAGGEMTLRSGPLLFDRPPRSARGSADSQPLRADRGTRHAILRRAEQRALRRVRRARFGSGDLGGSASDPTRGRRYGLCLARHAADAGQTMGATTDPRGARKRQLSARGHWLLYWKNMGQQTK
jgi:hypothetical protein